ncbi:MAG: hypothetical protein IKZ53_08250 [Selenomonadaceae bacterium]|nr:hypothetical protein [Selenomonadaceae bacterium]
MTAREIMEQLKKINQERLSEAHHDGFYDGFFSQGYADIDALNTVIILLMYLNDKKLTDRVTIAEIFEAADIEK